MTIAEIELIIKANAENIESKRRDMFVLAELIGFSFHEPSKMPKYEDFYVNPKKVEDEKSMNAGCREVEPPQIPYWQIHKDNFDAYAKAKNAVIEKRKG